MGRTNTPALTLNFQDDSIMLNGDTVSALGRPRQVQIMINEGTKKLLLRPCGVDGSQAVVLPSEHTVAVEIGGRSLLKKIRRITGWDDGLPRVCLGESYPEHRAIVYNLMAAQAIQPEGTGTQANGTGMQEMNATVISC